MESAELIAILREVRERVRARHPQTARGDIPLPDLMPLVHARDAAIAKVASIGTVNPRASGPLNGLVQAWKRLVARILDWHIREQVVFNRRVMECLDATVEALDQTNRTISELASRIPTTQELMDMRDRWESSRAEWERKLQQNEIQFLRNIAELQAAFQHRVGLMDNSYRSTVQGQHKEFAAALEASAQRFRADLERMRLDYDRMIHSELRLIRQRAELPVGQAFGPPAPEDRTVPIFDYARFAERFRGSEDYVSANQKIYLPYFAGRKNVLDVGCGRGEFLEMMRTAGVSARGIDLDPESVALCRHKDLHAEAADLFVYLQSLPEASLDGIFCSQVVEHLSPERVPAMIKLAASRLESGGVIAIETPNPECLAIFATHFYLDPTHTRPVPHPLLVFYLEEFGVGGIEVKRLSPASESMPSLASLPADFRDAFFGALDYAVIGRKL